MLDDLILDMVNGRIGSFRLLVKTGRDKNGLGQLGYKFG